MLLFAGQKGVTQMRCFLNAKKREDAASVQTVSEIVGVINAVTGKAPERFAADNIIPQAAYIGKSERWIACLVCDRSQGGMVLVSEFLVGKVPDTVRTHPGNQNALG